MKVRILVLLLFLSASAFAQEKASVSNLRKVVEVLAADSLRGRAYKSKELLVAQRYISEQFKQVGLKPIGSSFIQSVEWHDQYGGELKISNIVGVIEGNDPVLKNEYIVVGAHYDHVGYSADKDTVIYNGADDNASGVSGIIELSRIILASGAKPDRSILIVAFDAEEAGLVGSRKFVENSPVPLKSIKAMLSIDMIGHANLIKGLEIAGVGSLKDLDIPQSLFTATDSLRVKLSRNPSFRINHTDTQSFFKKGISNLYVNTGLKANYHKPTDDANTLDYTGMAFAVDNITSLVLYLAKQPTLHYTNPIPRLAVGVAASFGTNHFKMMNGPIDNKAMLTYSAGVSVLYKAWKKASVNADILFKNKTSRTELGQVNMPSLYIPVHLVLINPYNTARFFAGVGPYYSYSFGRYVKGDKLKLSNRERDDYGLDIMMGCVVMKNQIAFHSTYGLKRLMDNQPLMHYRSFEISFTRYLRY